MSSYPDRLSSAELKRFSKSPVKCPKVPFRIASLADYFAVLNRMTTGDDPFWFRGHSSVLYSLTPSALRYPTDAQRQKALDLLAEFKRVAEMKLTRPPQPQEDLRWVQLAQHYGLPTRLLDWSENATTALYFACAELKKDGFVFVINPIALNRLSHPTRPKILDPVGDAEIIRQYLSLGTRRTKKGRLPVAINPVWNSERLMVQKGVFTLHGTVFDMDGDDIPSLAAVPVMADSKEQLRRELQRVGIDEMTIFPEIEHSCIHLKRKSGLAAWE
jgi:hypothetical protein